MRASAASVFVVLVIGNVSGVFSAVIIGGQARDAVRLAERRLHEQRWQLEQLVPRDARAV